MIMGGGWYGSGSGSRQIYNYRIDSDSYAMLDHIDKHGLGMSCRDVCTMRALSKYHINNIHLTGCPAWFDLDYMEKDTIDTSFDDIQKIVISDPARSENYAQVVELAQYLQKKFPDAEISFAFHRGIGSDNYTSEEAATKLADLEKKILQLGIITKDISYGVDGLSIYDNCDLHIGYRVHAHIYCLSKRLRTILIEEDGRGAGVNMTLGLCQIKAYNDEYQFVNRHLEKLYRRLPQSRNAFLLDEVDDYLSILKTTKDKPLLNSFSSMKQYYRSMQDFVSQINNEI